MLETLSTQLAALSPAAKGAILFILLLQCTLQVYCIVDLVRRPVVTGGNKWIWGAVIIAAGLLGALLYLGLGRAQLSVLDAGDAAGGESATRRAIDKIYGEKS